jgi:uncharacterized protein (UPF0332 family)
MTGTSEDLIRYRLKRAKDTLREVDDLVKLGFYQTTINRLYYACFYAIGALFVHYKINTRTHSGVRQMFGKHFIQKGIISKELGKYFSILFEKRITGDYDDFIEIDKETVEELIDPARQLINQIESLILDNLSKYDIKK